MRRIHSQENRTASNQTATSAGKSISGKIEEEGKVKEWVVGAEGVIGSFWEGRHKKTMAFTEVANQLACNPIVKSSIVEGTARLSLSPLGPREEVPVTFCDRHVHASCVRLRCTRQG